MKAQHTPGPWKIEHDYRPFVIHTPDHHVVSTISGTAATVPEAAANARLISAAPDLLAALKQALRYIEVQVAIRGAMTAAEVEAAIVGPTAPSEVDIGFGYIANSYSTLARFDFCAARAAIAKAKGETP